MLVNGVAQQIFGWRHQVLCVCGVDGAVAALSIDFEHQIGQGVEGGLQSLLRFAQQRIRPHGHLYEQRAKQKQVSQRFVEVARDVVEVGDITVEREIKLAECGQTGCSKHAADVVVPPHAQSPPQQPGGEQVHRNQRVFHADLEWGQALASNEGARQHMRVDEPQQVQCQHQPQHTGQQGPLGHTRCAFGPGQGRNQQSPRANGPRTQPKENGFFW